MTEEEKTSETGILKWGVLSALAASLCCVGPLVLVLFGVGSASTALSIGYRKPYFLVFGLLIMGISFSQLYRKSCKRKHFSKKQQLILFGSSFLVALLIYYLLTYVITPLIAPSIYQLRFER